MSTLNIDLVYYTCALDKHKYQWKYLRTDDYYAMTSGVTTAFILIKHCRLPFQLEVELTLYLKAISDRCLTRKLLTRATHILKCMLSSSSQSN